MNITTSLDSGTEAPLQTWSLVRPSGEIPPARSGAASVVVAGKLYMFGVGQGRHSIFFIIRLVFLIMTSISITFRATVVEQVA